MATFFADVDNTTRDFIQAWGRQMDTETIMAELDRLEDDSARNSVRNDMQATLHAMADLEPDTSKGVRSIMRAV